MSLLIVLSALFCACFVRFKPRDDGFENLITKNEEVDAMLNDLEKQQRELMRKLK